MKNFLALTRRELGVYFVSPMAYIILTALLFIAGWIFVTSMGYCAANRLPVEFGPTLLCVMIVVVFSSALVTMRLIAEENSRGTLEIILTAPISDATFVLAKFSAAMVLLAYLLTLTLGYLAIISHYGQIDLGAAAAGYLGVFILGAVMYSIGLFISALCASQITAGVITFTVAVLLALANLLAPQFPENSSWRSLIGTVDLMTNFGDFLKGVIDRARVIYLLSVISFFLFLTTRVVESRRWR